jgi:hypothetical protein
VGSVSLTGVVAMWVSFAVYDASLTIVTLHKAAGVTAHR